MYYDGSITIMWSLKFLSMISLYLGGK